MEPLFGGGGFGKATGSLFGGGPKLPEPEKKADTPSAQNQPSTTNRDKGMRNLELGGDIQFSFAKSSENEVKEGKK